MLIHKQKVNDRQVGFYRVKYSPVLLDRLSAVVKSKVLTPSDRLGLVSDLSALTSSGEISTVQFLNFLSNFSEEGLRFSFVVSFALTSSE